MCFFGLHFCGINSSCQNFLPSVGAIKVSIIGTNSIESPSLLQVFVLSGFCGDFRAIMGAKKVGGLLYDGTILKLHLRDN